MADKTLQFHRFILDSIPVAMVTMDSDFKITSFNQKAEELTGFTADTAVGRLCSEILHSNRCKNDCPLQTVQEHHESATGLKAKLTNRHGETIPVRIGTTAIENTEGNFIGYLEIIEDISRFQEMEREKENFISMVAHDMKSPMVIIGGLIKRLEKNPACKENKKILSYLRVMADADQKLEALIQEFLEYSRLENNSFQLTTKPVNLEKLLRQIIDSHRHLADELKIDLQCDCQLNDSIEVDGDRINRVFTNLLNNAIKYSPKGAQVSISARETDDEVVIRFQDQGIGIAPEDLPYIFDAFYRAESGIEKRGHGLGLAAVKAIIRQHDGRIAVESTLGKGSIFTVSLFR